MPVILDLREFERFPARVSLTADPEKFSLNYDGVLGLIELEADLTVQHVGEEYYCQGVARATLAMECARCLGRFETRIENGMDFFCRYEGPRADDDERIADDEDYAYFVGNDLRADIGDMVRQAIVLGIDIKPICREDCCGLCPICGKNRNDGDCECRSETVDPRWEALRQLKDENQANDKE